MFSLNINGFNPFGRKQARKVASVGGIYLVCLNLPPDIHYNLENMCLVGVIPGPHHTSLDKINNFLVLLVNDFLHYWEGVYLSRTSSCLTGILVLCTLGPLVCDLPATRQVSRFTTSSATLFCSLCTQTLDNINNLNYHEWTSCNTQSHCFHTERWKNMCTNSEQTTITQSHGVQ